MVLLLLAAAPAMAKSPGDLRTISAGASDDSPGWDITIDNGMKLRVDLLRDDVLRVQADRNGKLLAAGDKAAPIVLPQSAAKVAFEMEEDDGEVRIRTGALVLHIQRRPLRLNYTSMYGRIYSVSLDYNVLAARIAPASPRTLPSEGIRNES